MVCAKCRMVAPSIEHEPFKGILVFLHEGLDDMDSENGERRPSCVFHGKEMLPVQNIPQVSRTVTVT